MIKGKMEKKMAQQKIDLLSLFGQVAGAVKEKQTTLNEADTYNHDHGDHMVEIFEVITQAMKEKKNSDPADQLEYAAKILRGKTDSGSSKLYAEGLKEAAKDMVGKNLDVGIVMTMVQKIMGASPKPEASQPAASGDMLSSLLGQLAGGADAEQDGLDLGDLLGAGMNFMSAKQSGKTDLEALTGALVSGSQMAQQPYREQSSQLVTSTLLKAVTSMMNK